MRVFFIITVFLLIQINLAAIKQNKRITKTAKYKDDKNLDGKLLHGDAKFDHNKTEGSWQKKQKLNVSDPSSDRLENEIKVRGHEKEKVNNKNQKLNVKEPSVDEAEKKIRIPGHENDKKKTAPTKLNINEPSVDDLEKKIKIPGHENDSKKAAKKLNIKEPDLEKAIKISGHENEVKEKKSHNISEPSLDEIEKQLKVQGHDKDKKSPEKIANMEPDIANLDGELLHSNPRFDHMKVNTKRQNLINVEPSNQLLEKMIEIENGSLNEAPKIKRSDILPNYEGFHGFLVHGDETFQHDKHGDDIEGSNKTKPADLDDFNKWLENQQNESKLDRFKRLNSEFESLSKRLEDHDHDFKTKHSSSSPNLKNPSEKLKRAIKEIEQEEMKRRRNRLKTDL